MSSAFSRKAVRRNHLADDNLLRAFTLVIDDVPDGINLGQGICDLEMPGPLVKGSLDAIDGGDRQIYTHYSGLDGLKEAIVEKLARHNELEVDMDQVMVTTGSSGAFFVAAMVLFERGDEVILFEPFYGYHASTLRLAEAVPVPVPLEAGTDALDPERLRAAITPRTRAIVLNTPVNPSGKVFTRQEMEALAAAIDGTDIVVMTDEVYEYMVFDGREHISPADDPRPLRPHPHDEQLLQDLLDNGLARRVPRRPRRHRGRLRAGIRPGRHLCAQTPAARCRAGPARPARLLLHRAARHVPGEARRHVRRAGTRRVPFPQA